MLNQSILVGRITGIKKEEQNRTILSLAVQRPYKDENGIYEIDLIPCILSNTISNTIEEYCKIGNIVGVKGSLCISENNLNLLVNKLTTLSTKKEKGD